MGVLLSFVVSLVVAAAVLMIVSRLNLGLKVDGFKSAIIAALVIAVIATVVIWLLGLLGITLGAGGLLGWIINVIVAALILILAAKALPGLTVNGFTGAIVAAIGIGVVGWIINWLLGLFGV